MRGRHIFVGVATCVLGAHSGTLQAQTLHVETPATSESGAKEAFERGTMLLETGDVEGALASFLRSRELLPNAKNTKNAAYCFYELGRIDEALPLYEELLTRFVDDIGGDARASLAPRLQELRRKLGSLDVAANVDGTLVIDGRARGSLPLLSPVRVVPGTRSVRVLRDGYETFETRVTIVAGQTVALDARLVPLARVGRLRVEGPGLEGAELFVDGALVGDVPWEGNLAPGEHVAFVRRGDRGSAPFAVAVLEGRVATRAATLLPLGGDTSLQVEPPTAVLRIDGVRVATGSWQGQLTVGQHTAEAQEEGYMSRTLALAVEPGKAVRKTLSLEVIPDHPRWSPRSSAPGKIRVDAAVGLAISPGLQSGAEAACGSAQCSLARGWVAFGRFGYVWPFDLSLELGAGYLRLQRDVGRTFSSQFGDVDAATSVAYRLDDAIRLSGPFVSAGVGYGHPVTGPLALVGRVHLAALYATVTDAQHVVASSADAEAPAYVEGSGSPAHGFGLLLLPAVEARFDVGRFYTAVELGVVVSLLDGPDNAHGELVIERGAATCDGYPAPAACAPGDNTVSTERSFGRFAAFAPAVRVGAQF